MPQLPHRLDDRAAKGLWVLLVAMGHTSGLWASHRAGVYWLYQFHVSAFLLLPLLRDEPLLDRRHLADRAVRYLGPLVAFCLVTLPLAGWVPPHLPLADRLEQLGLALVTGHPLHWKQACGFESPWFLPTLLGLNLLRQAWLRLPRCWQPGVAALGLLTMGSLTAWAQWLPLGLAVALVMLPLGVGARWLSGRWTAGQKDLRWLGFVAALPASALLLQQGIQINAGHAQWPALLSQPHLALAAMTAAVGMFLGVLWALPWLNRVRLLTALGEASLPFYLVHSLLLQAVLLPVQKLWPQFASDQPFLLGFLALSVAVAVGLPVARLAMRPALARWLLPRGLADWPVTARLSARLQIRGPENNP